MYPEMYPPEQFLLYIIMEHVQKNKNFPILFQFGSFQSVLVCYYQEQIRNESVLVRFSPFWFFENTYCFLVLMSPNLRLF